MGVFFSIQALPLQVLAMNRPEIYSYLFEQFQGRGLQCIPRLDQNLLFKTRRPEIDYDLIFFLSFSTIFSPLSSVLMKCILIKLDTGNIITYDSCFEGTNNI